tara:strand:- start:8489 stop:9988 length:1500 start_codon:yes stop_codon:yes gene_type:complete
MVNGKGAAYQSFRPLQGDIATDILNAEDQEFKHREEDRLIADRKAAAQAAKEKARLQGLNRVKNISVNDTESDTLNSTLAETINLAQDQYSEIFDVLDNPQKYNQKEQIQAQLKLDYLNNGGLVSDLEKMVSSVATEWQTYKNGNFHQDENYEKRFENGFKGITISLDDNLRPVALFKNNSQDLDGDGIIDVETLDSLNDVYARPEFLPKIDFESTVDEHSKNLVSAINKVANGFTTTKTTGVEPEQLENEANRVLFDEKGRETPIMKSFLRGRGLENTKENRDAIKLEYKNALLVRSKRGVEEDFDSGAFVSNKKENRLANEEQASLGDVVDPTKRTYGIYYDNIDTSKVNSVPVLGKIKIPALKTEKGDFVSNATPHNITRDKYGRMILEVSYQDTKTETMTQSQYDDALKKAIAEKDFEKQTMLEAAKSTEKGKRVTLPGKNKRKDITVTTEDEAMVANKLGYSIKDLNSRIYKEEPTEKKPVYKGLDDNGNPIFE